MAFIYDLNFEESREVLKDLGYYERFINGIKVEDNKDDKKFNNNNDFKNKHNKK